MTHRLNQLTAFGRQIAIAVVGIGSAGKGIALQAHITPGIQCVAIADIILERAVAWAQRLGRVYSIARTTGAVHDAIRHGTLAVCEDGMLVAQCELLDVFIESTSSVRAGGQLGLTALQHGTHVIMMNHEADLVFGPYLMGVAQSLGLVYSVCDGDQPAVLTRLIDDIEFMGFQLVMAGNIKGFLDRHATPTSIIQEADKRALDYRMCTSYTDGTKLCTEMAVIANGRGLHTLVPGMYGPRMNDVLEIFDHLDFGALWDGRNAFVDYALGARPRGGVFVIGFTDDKHQQDSLAWFPSDMGPGPFYVFSRPYHLSHFEAMNTVLAAVLDGQSVLKPDHGLRTNVYAYAKRDLKRGDTLDGIGGYTCYGLIDNCTGDFAHSGLPICLSDGVVVNQDVRRDQPIQMDVVSYDSLRPDFVLHAQAVAASRELRP
jgi:predicted homoserine dehydrogenase-like protein